MIMIFPKINKISFFNDSYKTSRRRLSNGLRLVLMGVNRLSIILSCVSILLLIGLDQWTKMLAVSALQQGGSFQVIPGLLEFTYVQNYGAAFGMLQNKTLFFLILTGICILVFIGILFAYKKHTPLTYAVCVLIIAGGIGNFIDRVRQSYVVDFFYFELINFPIFNVADIYVTTAAVALIVLVIFFYKDEDFVFLGSRKDKKTKV